MKLITETLFNDFTIREVMEGSRGSKNLYIEGVFMQAEVKNRNGRIYPANILDKEVNRYNSNYVTKGRAIGELNHPSSPSVNPERASHLVTELKRSGNDYYGKAKILDTPMGNVVKGLIQGGVQLGVSSRGLGSLKESNGAKYVQEDYYLACIDIVGDPSAPSAFVNGLYEGAEWVFQNGVIRQVEEIKEDLDNKFDEQKAVASFRKFIESLVERGV